MEHPFELRLGNNTRVCYSKIKEVMDIPNLIEVQKKSYEWFVKKGLKEVFRDVNQITDYTGDLVLEFIDYSLDEEPKYSVEECKERDATYSAPLRVKVRLINRATGEVKEQDIFMGDFPLMTETGTFVINGAERVIVSQLVRSPGIYYTRDYDKTGKELYANTVIPNRGAWLEYETDSNDVFHVRIDRTRKLPVTVLLRALGLGTDQQILNVFGEEEMLLVTLQKDTARSVEEGLIEIYKRLRPGEPPTLESASLLISSLFFDPKRYDLAKVGRYKFDKKLSIAVRITNRVASRNIVDKATGEILANKDTKISIQDAVKIQNLGINEVYIYAPDDKEIKIIGNGMVDFKYYIEDEIEDLSFEKVRHDILMPIIEKYKGKDELTEAIIANMDALSPKHITKEDILSSVNYLLTLSHEVGTVDDIDHLGNRRVKAVGELLQNQFRIGLSRLERVVRERMTVHDIDIVTPQALINIRPVSAAIKEFFGSSQLSQFMDQTNPLSELTNKRRLSALGPGGLSRERAGFEVRDVHSSHYGRMCPIETPEGPNIGLIGALSTYARVNEYGFIESPYLKVYHLDSGEVKVSEEIYYLTADVEDEFIIAQANAPLDENRHFEMTKAICRYRDEFIEAPIESVQFMDVSPKQLVSVATAMIPFLENDDANRALMGANMQKQAVPLIKSEAPIIGTGMEYKAAVDSGVCILAKRDGIVKKLSADKIEVSTGIGTDVYRLRKYKRSNQGTCINQKPIVRIGQKIKAGEVIADGPATENGEIALGKNVLIAFMAWEGYNYEDAILISEELVRDDVYTSIHIEEYESESRDTKLGPEEITRDIPNVGEESLKDLDERGIIRIGAEVKANDILVGKLTPKGETELSPEERLLRAIFGEKARETRDTSLRVPHGESGIVVDVKVFTRENGDELSPGVNELVRVYLAQKRKISVGDKMAGRHGNKGVISRILPIEDMPFMPDGTPLQIVLNPLGVPSRMNIGQVLEVHLGYAAKALGWEVATSVFDGANEEDIMNALRKADLPEDGKSVLYDGRTGLAFDNKVTVGYMYIMKLAHLVDDKIHARSTGPYSLVTQQPLGGKAQFGGQRFGEMEVWALEAYGAAYSLQEILTVKSDDVVGRVKTYEAIVKGENIPQPGIPESFKVLVKELQSLALDIKLYSDDDEEIELKESVDEDISNLHLNISGRELDDDYDFSEQEKVEIRRTMVPADFDDSGDAGDEHSLFRPVDDSDDDIIIGEEEEDDFDDEI